METTVAKKRQGKWDCGGIMENNMETIAMGLYEL